MVFHSDLKLKKHGLWFNFLRKSAVSAGDCFFVLSPQISQINAEEVSWNIFLCELCEISLRPLRLEFLEFVTKK